MTMPNLQLPPVPISGTITLQGWTATGAMPTLTCTLTPTGTTTGGVRIQMVTPAADGTWTLTTGSGGDFYTLGIKGSKWLRKDMPVNTTGGSVSGLNCHASGRGRRRLGQPGQCQRLWSFAKPTGRPRPILTPTTMPTPTSMGMVRSTPTTSCSCERTTAPPETFKRGTGSRRRHAGGFFCFP